MVRNLTSSAKLSSQSDKLVKTLKTEESLHIGVNKSCQKVHDGAFYLIQRTQYQEMMIKVPGCIIYDMETF